ncbi:MAG TPA: penicillin-insensitive murein endopeptidase [Polyangiaceae bacterium]|nr:penicillin-insensitive murein endopeptidase [Polyangiaceae bacterium]
MTAAGAKVQIAAIGAITAACALGCARAPSPLVPGWGGAIGTPNRGVLAGGAELPRDAPGFRWLRANDRHWALPRFVDAIERASAEVARERPGPPLLVGDLSTRSGGGPLSPHFSHRSGVDADLLYYVTTVDGAPVQSPGFVHVGADGLAWDDAHHRWLRLDVEREWLLVRALLLDPYARVEWLFVSDVVHAMLLEWAVARGEGVEVLARARAVMLQPKPGGVHDDHIHARTACSPEERSDGCVGIGPRRPWMTYDAAAPDDDIASLALALANPVDASERPERTP